MKSLRHKLNPKTIRDNVMRRGSHHHHGDNDSEDAQSGSEEISFVSGPSRGQSAEAPGTRFSGGGSGTLSPPPGLPPGVKIMSGPPPPGAHVMKMPPGSRPVSPSGVPTPPGAKMMSGPPPPGAKIMSGPPPPGAKMMGGPPPGAKMMSGPPPPGVKIMSGPPPAGVKMMSGPPPPGVKMMGGPPPGAKIMSGPPPPGARLVPSPPMSRPASPEARPGSTSPEMPRLPGGLPPGAKIMMGPPPPGARIVKSPPAGGRPGGAVSPPASPPMKLMIKTLSRPPSPAPLGASPPSSPALHNLSFSKSPPLPGVLAPTMALPKPSAVAPPRAVPVKKKPETLQIPSPSSLEQHDLNDESIELQPESSSSNIDFVVDDKPVTPLVPAKAPPKPAKAQPKAARPPSSPASSSQSSDSMFREEPDIETALPAVRTVGSPQSGISKDSSVRSSAIRMEQSTHGSSSTPAKKEGKLAKSSGDATKESKKKKSKSKSSASSSAPASRGAGRSHTPSQPASRDHSTTPSPGEVDRTRRRTPQPSRSVPSSYANGDRDRDRDDDGGIPTGMPLSALHTESLTPALRTKIADQFLSILCPQQYYGKVKKIASIRPIQADRKLAQGLKSNNSIYVATKGDTPNSCFFPQLRLLPDDAVNTSSSSTTVSTPVILYEAAPARMLFADSELEGRRLLGTNGTANSCFILSTSSILFRDPAQYVLPVATLTVEWTPYASAGSEPHCPIHKKELQLFDPFTKELVCALCASKRGDTAERLVVIPDVLSGDSRNRIQTSLTKQLDESQRSAKLFVGQHQRIAQMQESKKTAVSQQFDMLIAAIEAKRQEYLEACDAEFGYALNDVAREILVSDEKVQLLSAATDHLRADSTTRPIYSMQIATIAEALAASRTFPGAFAKGSLKVPAVSSGVMPNLEGVMAELQALNPSVYTSNPATYSTPKRRLSASPSTRRTAATSPRRVSRGPQPAITGGSSASPLSRARSVGASPSTSPTAAAARARAARGRQSPSNGLVRSPRRTAPSPPGLSEPNGCLSPGGRRQLSAQSTEASPRRDVLNDLNVDDDRDELALDGDSRGGIMSVPNSSGTSLFDFPLQDLIAAEESEEGCRPRCVQWAFRIEDPGDWVGIGVGVGSTIETWERCARNDLSHLWIVPYAGRRQTFVLRVTINAAAGHAKLTIHDVKGRQLDDGAIPQWNALRVSYPQVTFGGRVGRVRLVEAPSLV